MSVSEFSSTIQSKVYKDWLSELQSNLITTTVEELRKTQITADKTDFLITKDSLKNIFETLSGNKVDSHDVDIMMAQLSGTLGVKSKNAKIGQRITVQGKDALLFESIGFNTITALMNRVLDTPEIEENLHSLSLEAQDAAKAELTAKYGKKIPKAEFNKADNIKLTIGDFFDKGHVVSLAANLGKQFATDIRKASTLGDKAKAQLLDALEQYIVKLQADDLASANLPDAINQEVYAKYIKSPDKYLVEFQVKDHNQLTGRASIPIVNELRNIFKGVEESALNSIASNSALGKALAFTRGSPSYVDLVVRAITDTIAGKKKSNKVYSIPKTKVLTNTVKIVKPKKNTEAITAAKKLANKIKNAKISNDVAANVAPPLFNLQSYIAARLAEQIKNNMGTGYDKKVLNYRSGRLADSASIERVSQSRAGMVSVFYSYMRNPYGTFSTGGAQQDPASRDPKLLISKSIREIGASIVGNRMRAILV